MALVEAFDLFSNSTVMVVDFSRREEAEKEWLRLRAQAILRMAFVELIFEPEPNPETFRRPSWLVWPGLYKPVKEPRRKKIFYHEEPFFGPAPASNPYQPRHWVAMNQAPKRPR